MTSGIHHETRIKRGAILHVNDERGRNAVGIATVVVRSTMRELKLRHQRTRARVVNRIRRVVMRHEHEILPVAVVAFAEFRGLC